ncbi:MAG: RND transporter [Rhodanobacteraceae bacterium]|nr:MAG: RND transporter [Rhodanobacteraceae bacterium]
MDWSGRHPFIVVSLALLLVVLSVAATRAYLGIDTDTDHMFSSQLPWRQRSIQFDRQFPQFSDTLIAVVRAPTVEQARATATALAGKLAADPRLFRSVATPGISPFLDREGLLLLSRADLTDVINRILQAQPLLGPLAMDPSGRGLFQGLNLLVEGVRHGLGTGLTAYDAALDHVARTLEDALQGRDTPLSWQALLVPQLVDASGPVELVLIHPALNHHVLEPGAVATQAMMRIAHGLPEVKAGRVRVDYTGSIPLSDEQFQSLTAGVLPMVLGSTLLLLIWLTLALHSWRLIVPVVLTLVAGLIYTLGFAALTIGRLNLVSVAFTVLFVGLAVDFGIQFSVRLHARQRSGRRFADAMHATAVKVAAQIGLAALAIACGFLAFAPTKFSGVAELGIIAGVGMLVALLCTLTILPALLALLAARGPQHEGGPLPGGARADAWLARHRRPTLVVFGLLAIAGLWAVFNTPFDANPLHTQRADSEAMRTLTSLQGNPTTNPFTINVLVKGLPAARALSARLGALPEVAQVISGADFIPQHQAAKLAQIQQAADLMFTVTEPPTTLPAPTVDQLRQAARDTHDEIAGIASALAPGSPLLRIGHLLGRLADGPASRLVLANQALSRFLPAALAQLASSLAAKPVARADLPPAIERDWFTGDGQVRVQVTPTARAQSTAGLRHFVRVVRSMAPQALGPAIDTIESADTILGSFRQAALYATLAIAVVLLIVLRRVLDAALILVTLLMSALLTALLARLGGMSIDYANIIALPLLLGVGVSFNVYFVMNWRNGHLQFLGSPTARAILFSALTTGTAFGTLAVSRNPGTASMGLLLLLSLLGVLASTFIFLPSVLYTLGSPYGNPPRPGPPGAAASA